ncbi:hypothetical protein BD309DRAFT_1079798 [Dichomitus squalens]|nr:hypothetical protein BD309DRAFT_1079798 [Dichomitus squalens]
MHPSTLRDPRVLVQPAVQANKEHQYALKVYTERLEAELEHLDKLLAATEISDDEDEGFLTVNSGGDVYIPGAVRPRGLIPPSLLTDEDSPFYDVAARRQRYENFTVSHPMNARELDALAEAVRSENYRLHALEAQARGLSSFLAASEPPPDFSMNKQGIDWERVAQKVSFASTTVQRTARECEIRWLGERHPQFNNAQWPQSEITKVRELVGDARQGEIDWVKIAEKLGTGRTPVDCMRHAIPRRTHTWTPDADQRLLEAVDAYGTDSWALVARAVSEDATAAQCQGRYLRTLDPTLRRGPWAPDEDEQLRRAVAAFGHAWIDVAAFVEGRNNEQCRERYQEYLNPTVTKGKWTEDQDSALLKVVEQVGEGKWKEVSRVLNIGRTDNMCRMRYTLLVKRKKAGTASPGPSGAASAAPSRRSTPADKGTPEILILHPDTYHSQSSAATPAPAPASASVPAPAPKAKPKPKPRARRKQPTALAEDIGERASESSAANVPAAGQPERQATEVPQQQAQPELSVEGEDAQPSKRRRTVPPSPPPAVQWTAASTEQEGAQKDATLEDTSGSTQDAQPNEIAEPWNLNDRTFRGEIVCVYAYKAATAKGC